MTNEHIAEAARSGKIGDEVHGDKKANLEKALDTAYLAFEDGLYCIFINDEQTEKLDDSLNLKRWRYSYIYQINYACRQNVVGGLMLNFYGNKFTSKVNSFISKIKTEVKTLDRDNQRFIEDIFTKRNYHGYGEILQDNFN